MGFYLVTTMRIVPAAHRAPGPDDVLLGLPLPPQLARRREHLADSTSILAEDPDTTIRGPVHPHSHHHHHHHISLPAPQLRLPHSRAPSTAPASFASFSFGSNPSAPAAITLGEEEEEALRALHARVPLAERHIQRLVDAAADWALEHPSAPAPPDDLCRQAMLKLHAHLPFDDGTHYCLRLSIRTPLEPLDHLTRHHFRGSSSSSVQLTRSASAASACSSGHAPWGITAHVAPAPAMPDSRPAVRMDTEPARRFATHPPPLDAAGAFSVTHKTSFRERYEEAQHRVNANLTPNWDPLSGLRTAPTLLETTTLGRKRSHTTTGPPPGSTAGLAEKLVRHDPSAPRDQLAFAYDNPSAVGVLGDALEPTRSLGALDAAPSQAPVFDVLLWSRDAMGNTRLLESGIANLLFEDLEQPTDRPERFITPIVKPRDGPLPGVVRAELLAQGLISEEDISVIDLVRQPEHWRIYLCNSVRGVFEVQLVE